MAKPIEATPVLTGNDAKRFLDDMAHPERITPQERNFLMEVRKIKSAINI